MFSSDRFLKLEQKLGIMRLDSSGYTKKILHNGQSIFTCALLPLNTNGMQLSII